MSRGIDHLVLAVRDLAEGAAFYERLGFNLTPKAQHPFGTGNHLAQLGNDFLEILSVTKPADLIEHRDGAFSFGAHNRDYLQRQEGMSMIALQGEGWQQDRQTFTQAGFDLPEPFTFSRLARQPDGSDVTVGFDLTFVPDDGLPDAAFFTCNHQHAPEYFYKPEFQIHDNGAQAVDEVFMVSEGSTNIRNYLTRLYGADSVFERNDVLGVQVGDAVFSILTKAQLDDRFPGHVSAPLNGDAGFSGYRIRVTDLDKTRTVLVSNDIGFADEGQSLWLSAFGTIIAFSANSKNENAK
jgi:catechol 2,3-dioxygenase-like lactoylglutathione lyase family enzyme